MRKLTSFLFVAVLSLTEQAFANEVLSYGACAFVEEQTVHWGAANETVLVRTLVESAKGEEPETQMTIFRENGSIIFEQSGEYFREGGPLYEEALDCGYHARGASSITIDTLKGESFNFYGTEVKSSDDVINMIKGADACGLQNFQGQKLGDSKSKCDVLVYEVDRFLEKSSFSKSELLEHLSKDRPLLLVSDSFLSIDLYAYDPDTQKTLHIAPLSIC